MKPDVWEKREWNTKCPRAILEKHPRRRKSTGLPWEQRSARWEEEETEASRWSASLPAASLRRVEPCALSAALCSRLPQTRSKRPHRTGQAVCGRSLAFFPQDITAVPKPPSVSSSVGGRRKDSPQRWQADARGSLSSHGTTPARARPRECRFSASVHVGSVNHAM